MIDNIGFFLPKLNGEKHSAIVEHISTYISANPDKQIVVFCSNADIVFPWNVPVLHINEAKYFSGSIMVFDILSALIIKSFNFLRLLNLYKVIFFGVFDFDGYF